VIGLPTARRELSKLKNVLHAISGPGIEGEGEARELVTERRMGRFARQMGRVLRLLAPDVFRNYFGTDDRPARWQELNNSSNHRD
jgi:hypothetical protein